jgi:AhpD family alkylhydroperoxidase
MSTTTTSSTTAATDTDGTTDRVQPRIALARLFPEGHRAMAALDREIGNSGLEESLINLVNQRASQINGCAYCLDMHAKDARAAGESQQRLDVLPAWDEVPLYTDRERAALALCESMTLVADTHVPDDVVEAARAHFTDDELARLVFAIVTINAWNRIAITARLPLPPG